MKIQTGIDIIEVERIQEAIEKGGDHFKNRIYTEQEIAYCESKKKTKYQHYAARFAAKEAVYKAISNLISDRSDVLWKQIEVEQDENGRPLIQKKKIEKIELEGIDISLSHLQGLAVASVVVMIKEKEEKYETI